MTTVGTPFRMRPSDLMRLLGASVATAAVFSLPPALTRRSTPTTSTRSLPATVKVSAPTRTRAVRQALPRHRSTGPRSWLALIGSYHDWDAALMKRLAWCESRWQTGVVNPVAVYEPGRGWLHSTGVLGVLGGSTNGMTNVRQAHALWKIQGYGAWSADFSSGCAYSAP